MYRLLRGMIWFNFISDAFHTLDTTLGIHKPLLAPGLDWAIHSIGLFVFGTLALYGTRATRKNAEVQP